MTAKVIKLPCLGRPFSLGQLYDCRSEELIPGITLWDHENLEKDIVTQSQETSSFNIIASDTISDKASSMDIEASLKLGILSGMIDVEGSAKFLNDRKSSQQQSRVTLQYKCTTKFQHLTMDQLGAGNCQHGEVFEQGTATHVVTGIIYGAQAFFVFDRTLKHDEDTMKVMGELKVAIRKIPNCEIGGSGKVDISSSEKEKTDSFECAFHGDFRPPTNPASYEDAIRMYKELPKLLGDNGEKAVPVTVWLYPLYLLDSKAAKLVRNISENVVNQTEQTLEHLHEIDIKCNDMIHTPGCNMFPSVHEEIITFQQLVKGFKINFERQLLPMIPRIKDGSSEESELGAILDSKESTPFCHHQLHSWIEQKQIQVAILNTYVKYFRAEGNIVFSSSPDILQSILYNPDHKFVICYMISMKMKDYHVINMKSYMKHTSVADTTHYSDNEAKFTTFKGMNLNMKERARKFKKFALAEVALRSPVVRTICIVAENPSEVTDPGASIYFYKDGKLVDECYEPPSNLMQFLKDQNR